jgi:ADP-heptose:LPS heptosyltransferase
VTSSRPKLRAKHPPPPALPPEAALLRNAGSYGPKRARPARRIVQLLLGGAEKLLPAGGGRPVDWGRAGRVAVLRFDHLGDLLMSFPALAALRKALPKARIELFVGPWNEELARLCPSVDAVRVVDVPWFRRPVGPCHPLGLLKLAWRLRHGRYDLGIELRGDLRQLLALRLAGVPQRLGHTLSHGKFLLTSSADWAPRHEVEQNLELLRQGGLAGVPKPGLAAPSLAVPPKARAAARALLAKQRLKPGFLALHPSAGGPSRLWPEEHWVELLRGLPAGPGLALLGTGAERPRLEDLRRRSGRADVAVLAGDTSVAVLAGLLGLAGGLVGLNSGPGHLAGAVGTPVLSLFSGANDPARWGPRGPQVRVMTVPVPCSPCELAVCPFDNACMRFLSPAAVLPAARALRKAR